MEINKKKPQITSSETSAKTSDINGFQQLTVTDKQRVKATPKRKARGSNPPAGATASTKSSVIRGFCAFL